jgi:WD40 repeat protein
MVPLRPMLIPVLCLLVSLLAGCDKSDDQTRQRGLSADGKSSLQTVKANGKQSVVHKGKTLGTHEQIFSPELSPTGDSAAYIARKGKTYQMFKDGKAVSKPCTMVLSPTYGPQGKSFAYAEGTGPRAETWRVVRDGKQVGDTYDRVGPPAYSPDGKSIAFAAGRDGKTYVVKNGVLGGAGYDDVLYLGFTPDGGSLIHVAVDFATDKKWLVRDGRKVSANYDRLWGWAASPDGSTLAWVARRSGDDVLVKDGTEVGKPFTTNRVVGLVFSPDGKSVAFAGGRGEWFLRKDDAPLGETFQADDVRQLLFSPDGSSIACSATERRSAFVLKNGSRVGDTYHAVSGLKNRSDGAHFEFHGMLGGRTELIQVPW